MRFRKKPVVIEALQWKGSNLYEVARFIYGYDNNLVPECNAHYELFISTLEGLQAAPIGDWIIRGVKGECYPCKPDIFTLTYESIPDA
jgi:hypothetical protein